MTRIVVRARSRAKSRESCASSAAVTAAGDCDFPPGVAIRPTPDRVRETLFNWLQPRIAGARVLDLFAGSGALGLEALSRGAAHVTFVEQDRRAAAAIDDVGARMAGEAALRWHAPMRSPGWRSRAGAAPFDIVFLDPPYDADLLAAAAAALRRAQACSRRMRASTSNIARASRCRRCRTAGGAFATAGRARSGIIYLL